ncbi:MAG: HNH endonuclease [Eubacteriales bacterium]
MAAEFAKDFYASPIWRNLRRVILKRDRYTCRDCPGRASEVHHTVTLTPDNINDRYISLNPALLVSLCHDCHTRITKQNDDEFYFDANGQLILKNKN